MKAGIIDPAKVTRSALQNAASIAALFLTTEAVVADKPEKEKALPVRPAAVTWTSSPRSVWGGRSAGPPSSALTGSCMIPVAGFVGAARPMIPVIRE